ncbi:hypothetical protein CDL15_Pgr014348 [Punica granatum]|uniref:Uncharacterized protein n=1 Tax=Punica granatum TaxID=22663 RepID=A0A218WCZ0_PUNGR|nr:hypothetical protein CDL15_Pgr014348 [Punica granatum]
MLPSIVSSRYISNSHLLRKGANIRVKDQDGATPLHYAFQVSARQTVKLLTKCKVDVNVADNEGKTPLDLCLSYGKDFKSYDLAKMLKLTLAINHDY